MTIYNTLLTKYPEHLPICKQMLYFGMIYSKVDIDKTDVALGYQNVSSDCLDMVTETYWMMNSHIYVDILRYNEERLKGHPIFESVTADDLYFVCIQKVYVDKCVDLFWDKFIDMGFDVFSPNIITFLNEKNVQDVQDEHPPIIQTSLPTNEEKSVNNSYEKKDK